MKQLQAVFEQYLESIERLENIKLGTNKSHAITAEDNHKFVELLDKKINSGKRLVIMYLMALFILFGLGVFGVFYNFVSSQTTGLSLGAIFIFVLAVVEKLRRIWREKTIMDVTLIILRELPPQEAAKFIETLYWNSVRKS